MRGYEEKMAEQKDLSSFPVTKTPKSQLLLRTINKKKTLESRKEIFYLQRKRRYNETVRGVHL